MLPFDLPVPVALARPIEHLPDAVGDLLLQAKVDGSPDTQMCLTGLVGRP